MAAFSCNSDFNESRDNPIAPLMGPGHVDQTVRQAIQFRWMMAPSNRQTVDEIERQLRRLVDRALEDFREDANAFRSADDG